MKLKHKTIYAITSLVITLSLFAVTCMAVSPQALAVTTASTNPERMIVSSLRSGYNGSLAQAIVGRAIWYMEYGFIKYGHSSYATTGYCDCSQFVSMVYKNFGYSVTSVSRDYNKVGVKVSGVYVRNGKLVGVEKLKPGDILTFQRRDHITHVAIFMGVAGGKPCFIGTTSGYPTAIGIVAGFDNWYGTQFHGVRRVLPKSAFSPESKINDRGPVIPAKYQIKPNKPIVLPKYLEAGF